MNSAVVVIALMMTLTALAFASSVSAAPDSYVEIGSFGRHDPGSGDEQFSEPRRVDTYASTGEIFIVDRNNNRVQVFEPAGNSATYLTQFGSDVLNQPFGLAIDQNDGAVYVTSAGSSQIVKFNRTAGDPPTFTPDPTFTSPAPGSNPGEIGNFAAGIAVDPMDGDIWIADPGNGLVQQFGPNGTFIDSFDGSTSPNGPFSTLSDVELDSNGNVVVAHEPFVTRFGSDGAFQLTIGDAFSEAYVSGVLVAVNPDDQILIGHGYGGQAGAYLDLYEGATFLNRQTHSVETADIWGWAGLAVDGSSGRLYAMAGPAFECCGISSARVYRTGIRPAVTIDATSGVTSSEAHFSGTVNPNGTDTTWQFEYSTDGTTWLASPIDPAAVGAGASPVPVSTNASSLVPSTLYKVRLSATNDGGTRISSEEQFTTLPSSPTVYAAYAAPRTTVTARLNARINPNSFDTTYYFQYGPDTNYGSSAPVSQDASAGNGSTPVLVSSEIEGLQPGTNYHYRLVGTNTVDTTFGEDHTFSTRTTAEATLPRRAVELVNPPDKGNQAPAAFLGLPVEDGGRVTWTSANGLPGSPSGSGSVFLASRTSSGWKSQSVLPPANQLIGDGRLVYTLRGFSADFSKTIFTVSIGFGSESITYVRRESDGSQTELAKLKPSGNSYSPLNLSSDLTHAFELVPYDLLPQPDSGHAPGTHNLYDFGGGTAEIVGRMPGTNAVPACGLQGLGSQSTPAWGNGPYPFISTDGTKVFFETRGNNCEKPNNLYVRDLETDTSTLISGPPVSGTAGDAFFVRASTDGQTAIFLTTTRLDATDKNSDWDIYRYTANSGNKCLTCVVRHAAVVKPSADRGILVSDDFSHVYFTSTNRLAPGIPPAGPEVSYLYSLHDEVIDYISPYQNPGAFRLQLNTENDGTSRASADGKVLVFISSAAGITTDDPGNCAGVPCKRYYRYDEKAHGIECLTCSPPGAGVETETRTTLVKNSILTSDGSTFLFSSATPFVRDDVNGTRDVYEWHNGSYGLITDGVSERLPGPGEPELAGVSPSGVDVYFTTGAHITGHEVDRAPQLYDARIGGGFAPPPTPLAPCVEDACQGPLIAAPDLASPGSASFDGPGSQVNKFKKAHRKRLHKNHRHRHKQRSKKADGKRPLYQSPNGHRRG